MTTHARMLARQWALVRALSATRRGLTVRQIVERTGASRPTVYRDLKLLEAAGVPVVAEGCNGEVRYRLDAVELPPLRPTPLQVTALRLVRGLLQPLEGTDVARAYDEVLAALGRSADAPMDALAEVDVAPGPAKAPAALKVVSSAIRHRRRVRLAYRAGSHGGAPKMYVVDPIGVRLVGGDAYFAGVLAGSDEVRRFKAARIVEAELLGESAERHPGVTVRSVFSGAVKAWGGEIVDVRVRLSAHVAWRAGERPLAAGQVVKMMGDGSAIVVARVAGIVEAARWVVGWGKEAEAIAPRELREAVAEELREAAGKYRGGIVTAKVQGVREVVSPEVRRVRGK